MSDVFYYHINTTNKSFLKIYKFLKDLGIKNNKFFLKIYDKDLMTVTNPLQAKEPSIRARVIKEITRNPWYYYREICRIPVSGGTSRFQLNLGNLALLFNMHNNISSFIEMPRQQGKTIGVAAGMSYIMNYGTENSNIIYGNKSGGDSQLNLSRTIDIIRTLPEWLRFMTAGKDTDNVKAFKSFKTKNKITTISAPKDPISADKLGRGLTTPIQWFDEIAFISHNDIIWEAAAPAYSQASLEAAKLNKPRFRVVSTTPNNQDLGAGEFAYKLREGAAPFIFKIYDMTHDELEEYITNNSDNDFIHIIYTWKELGRDHNWYKAQCRALLGNRLKIKRELDLVWPMSSDSSFFDEESIEAIKSFEVKISDQNVCILNKYYLHFLDDFDQSFHKKFILGIDCATGAERDASTIVVIDPDTLEPVGYFESNKIGTEDFKKVITYVMKVILPNSICVPERNSVGIAVINHLLSVPSLKKRIYYYYRPETATEKVRNRIAKSVNADDIRVKIYGVDTTSSSRPLMIENLQILVRDKPSVFKIPRIIEQIQTLQIKKNGKIEHANSAKDDVLFGYLIGLYAVNDPNFRKVANFESVQSSRSINFLASVNISSSSNDEVISSIRKKVVNFEESVNNACTKPVNRQKAFAQKIFDLNK